MENALQTLSEIERLRARHRAYYLKLVQNAAPKLLGPHSPRYHAALANDHENIRSATHSFARAAGETETGAQTAELLADGARLCVALYEFWTVRGFYGEGRDFCEQFLQQDDADERSEAKLTPELRARLLRCCASVWGYIGDYPPVVARLNEALRLDRAAQNDNGISDALTCLGIITKHQGHEADARALFDDSLMHARRGGDDRLTALALFNIGELLPPGEEKATYYQEALAISRKIGDLRGVSLALGALAWLRQMQGDEKTALVLYEECRTIRETLGDRHLLGWLMRGMARSALVQGDRPKAMRYYDDAIEIFRSINNREGIGWMQFQKGIIALDDGVWPDGEDEAGLQNLRAALQNFVLLKQPRSIRYCLEGIAFRLVLLDPETAVVLWGAARALRHALDETEEIDFPRIPTIQADVKAKLGEVGWDKAFARGLALSVDEAVALALKE